MKFLGINFIDGSEAQLKTSLLHASGERYSYCVTPNVQHVNILHAHSTRGDQFRQAYCAASFVICDSRILQLLASLAGRRLFTLPGSDLIAQILCDPRFIEKKIGVIGPGRDDFEKLAHQFVERQLTLIDTPLQMSTESEAFAQCLQAAAAADWDILLICLGAPKQEIFANRLKALRRDGVALCVGASIDYLTGKQARAPSFIKNARLEWLFRLLSQPRRMFKRYMLDFFALVRILSKELASSFFKSRRT